MKKQILFLVILIATVNIKAQLVVDSLGHVGICTETPVADLSLGASGDSLTSFYCYTNANKYGIRVSNFFNSADNTYGFYSMARNYSSGSCYGAYASALSNNNTVTSRVNIGVGGYASCAYTAVGVMGARAALSSIPCINFAGVYGAETNINPSFGNYSGTYAGYFKGKVRVTNGIYATLLSPSASTLAEQDETVVLSERVESVTNKLCQVHTLQFSRYKSIKGKITEETYSSESDAVNKGLDSLAVDSEVEPDQYLSPIQYGLDANQLKAVYPELVYEDANGNVSINYVEIVPLLVKSINEMSAKIETLEQQLEAKKQSKRVKSEATEIENNISDIDMVRMDQNKPNPFSESTVIGLNIPEKTQKANIFIYDFSGKQIKSIHVLERGETNITVYAGDLGAGMYIYTLMVEGKVVVTRRMIVEK